MRVLFSFVFILLFLSAFAQKGIKADKRADERILLQLQDSLRKIEPRIFTSKTDDQKYDANKKFIALLAEALSYKESFDFPFDSLKGVARLVSPDKKFRIINWNLPRNDGTFEYFGFIQSYSKKEKSYMLFRLADKSDEIANAPNTVGTPDKWYGMLYYKIIETKHQKKTYYTLLGWDGNDNMSRKKMIDVVSFGSDGAPKFGDGIFSYEKKFPRRVIFEYAPDAVMTLNYAEASKQIDNKNITTDMIVFSHLMPSHPALEGQYQFYVTDGSFDAFMFKNGKWEYVKDVDARNSKSKTDGMEGKAAKDKPIYTPKKGKKKEK
jgi:hypothetical protein